MLRLVEKEAGKHGPLADKGASTAIASSCLASVLDFDYVRDDAWQRDSARSVQGEEMDSLLGIGIKEGLGKGSCGK